MNYCTCFQISVLTVLMHVCIGIAVQQAGNSAMHTHTQHEQTRTHTNFSENETL